MLERTSLALGRAMLSAIFVLSGFGKIMNFKGTVDGLSAAHWPAASVFIVLSITVEVGGGLMLLFGIKVRWAAILMALWLIPVTLTFHNFWAYKGTPAYAGQQINFLKNVAIAGGLLVAASYPVSAQRAVAVSGAR